MTVIIHAKTNDNFSVFAEVVHMLCETEAQIVVMTETKDNSHMMTLFWPTAKLSVPLFHTIHTSRDLYAADAALVLFQVFLTLCRKQRTPHGPILSTCLSRL
jgi:hypothetical protein